MIYIFHLRCYYTPHRTVPKDCYYETIDVDENDFESALKAARKECKRRNPIIKDVDDESIIVMDWEQG